MRKRVLTAGNGEVIQVEAGGVLNIDGAEMPRVVLISQADYEALATPRDDTLYLIPEE